MKLKIKDIIPDVEVFQLINNEPVKIRVKKMFQEKNLYYLACLVLLHLFALQSIFQDI